MLRSGMLSQVRLSSVTFVRPLSRLKFLATFLCHFVPWPRAPPGMGKGGNLPPPGNVQMGICNPSPEFLAPECSKTRLFSSKIEKVGRGNPSPHPTLLGACGASTSRLRRSPLGVSILPPPAKNYSGAHDHGYPLTATQTFKIVPGEPLHRGLKTQEG